MGAKRGEIWTVKYKNTEKLVVIVSADFRADSKLLSGIILTDNAFEVNAEFYTKGGLKYANPNAVTTIVPDNLIDYMRTASASEVDRLDEKIVNALGLEEYINDHFKNSCTVDVAEPQDVKPEEENKPVAHTVSRKDDLSYKEMAERYMMENAKLKGKLEAVKELLERFLSKE